MLGIFLDTETNGLNFKKHTILDIALQIVDLKSGKTLASLDEMIKPTEQEWQKSSKESLKVNGITLGEIKKRAKERQEVEIQIKNLFREHGIKRSKAVFICQNPSFDRVFFSSLIHVDYQEQYKWPYYWLDLASMYFSKKVSSGQIGVLGNISKDAIALDLNLEAEKKPHRALNGVKHLRSCYEKLIGYKN
jgi:oligoribonuclease